MRRAEDGLLREKTDEESLEMNTEGAGRPPFVWLCSLTSSLVPEGDQAPAAVHACVCVCVAIDPRVLTVSLNERRNDEGL